MIKISILFLFFRLFNNYFFEGRWKCFFCSVMESFGLWQYWSIHFSSIIQCQRITWNGRHITHFTTFWTVRIFSYFSRNIWQFTLRKLLYIHFDYFFDARKKIVKVCLHSSSGAQTSFHFDEFCKKKNISRFWCFMEFLTDFVMKKHFKSCFTFIWTIFFET